MVLLFGRGKKEIVQEQKERKEIAEAVAEERKKQARLQFERKKAKAVARIRRPISKRFKGVAIKAGRRARKEIGRSIKGFAQKIGKPRESERETLVIIGGRPTRRIKGRVRVIRAGDTGLGGDFDEGLGVGGVGELGLSVGLLGEGPRKKKGKGLKPIRFF